MIILDDLNQPFEITTKPRRVISLIPSITETLFAYGLSGAIAGITDFCPVVKEFPKSVERVGGPKHLNIEKIISLEPDLIIANAEENEKDEIHSLREKGQKIFVTFPKSVPDAISMMEKLSRITMTEETARPLISQIQHEYDELLKNKKEESPFKVLYLIWKNPFMSVNEDTFINDVLKTVKGKNIFEENAKRYFNIHIEEIVEADPDVIILPSEPYKFTEEDALDLKSYKEISAVKNEKIFLLKGEYFCWYGVRLLESFRFLKNFKFI